MRGVAICGATLEEPRPPTVSVLVPNDVAARHTFSQQALDPFGAVLTCVEVVKWSRSARQVAELSYEALHPIIDRVSDALHFPTRSGGTRMRRRVPVSMPWR